MASRKRGTAVKNELSALKKSKQQLLSDGGSSKKKPGSDEFVDGAIVRVKMRNFLTYDECEFSPGPHLNLLCAPNGTGKSSVVCAICLGLAGQPKLLGRATEVGEFVKHGASQGMTEIELYCSSGQNYVITREIYREGNRSVWKVNGKATSMKEVQEITAKMNVQINNLCQFLPQEKVADFAKMTPQQLLVATEEAVGPPGMRDDHQRLIDLRKAEKDMELSLGEKSNHLDRLKEQNERLEHEVQRYKERERHLEKVQILEKKRPWAEYEEARKKFVELKLARDDARKRLDDCRKENAPMQARLDNVVQQLNGLDRGMREQGERGNEVNRKAKAKSDQLENLVDKIEEQQNQLKEMQDEEKRRQKKISDLERQIQGYETELEKLPDPSELQPQIDEINGKARLLTREITQIQQNGNRIVEEKRQLTLQGRDVQSRLHRLEDMRNQRLELLRSRFRDTYNAVLWLRNNLDKFKHPVYEPLMLQVNMHNVAYAKYLESVIAQKDMTSFLFEDRGDMNLFMEEVRDKQGLRVNGVATPNEPMSHYKPRRDIEQLSQWGFECYLIELFTAPEPVTKYICENYRIHEIPLGTEWTAQHAEKVIDESGLRSFYTPSSRYRVRFSKYGNKEKSVSVENLRDARIFNIAVDLEMKRSLETELQGIQTQVQAKTEEYKELQDKEKGLTKELEDYRNQKKNLSSQLQRRRTLGNQMETKQKALETAQRETPNLKAQEAKVEREIDKINAKRTNLADQYKDAIKECMVVCKERVRASLQHAKVTMEKNRIENLYRQSQEQISRLEEEQGRAQATFEAQKSKARHLKKVAHEVTGIPEREDLPASLKEAFRLLPDTLDEIDEKINEEKARAEYRDVDKVYGSGNASPRSKAHIHPSRAPGSSNTKISDDHPRPSRRKHMNIKSSRSLEHGLASSVNQVVRQYEARKKEIEGVNRQVQEQVTILSSKQDEIASIKERWLTPLQELLAQINTKYGQFFRMMGCAGEVCLAMEQGEQEYDKYGVQIKVKFRAKDALYVLTPFHQSGGERSVATMLFLMALQELTNCPFRVVDEINQGMDPNNERRVFDLVVKTACKPNTSQYFLITPKLLPDLEYTDKMTILFVFNGHWMMPHTKWNLQNFIQRRKALNATA